MIRKVEHQVQGYRTHDGAGVSLVRVIGLKTVEIFDPLGKSGSFYSR